MINAYAVDDITIIRTVYDAWGEPETVTSVGVKGYVDWTSRLVRNLKGEQVIATATVYLPYDGLLTHADILQIDGVKHSIINLVVAKHFSKDHYEVFIQ
jgi:hypothetical protein